MALNHICPKIIIIIITNFLLYGNQEEKYLHENWEILSKRKFAFVRLTPESLINTY